MNWADLAVLDELGLSVYDKKTLAALVLTGVADAATLCREGKIPSSKIYQSTEKLARLGLAEIQNTRPRLYAAVPIEAVAERLAALGREQAEAFARKTDRVREALEKLPGRMQSRRTAVDLALTPQAHVRRHLVRLALARESIVSYLEEGDLTAIHAVESSGFHVLKRISRNAGERKVEHRAVFGFRHQNAPKLLDFLRVHVRDLGHLSGVRYSGELGHPFHIIDRETVILALDHPFVPGGRVASLLFRDAELAKSLLAGFDELWSRAMKDLREVRFHPGASRR